MTILDSKENRLCLTKNAYKVSNAVLKFLGSLLFLGFVTLVVNDSIGSNEFVRDIAGRSLLISFWLGLALLILNNALDKQIAKLEGDDFSQALESIESVSGHLENIRDFLKETQGAITETRRNLEQMEEEKDLLEPVLKTKRENVEKIMAAQARYQHSRRWRELLISFGLGITASFVATMLYDRYF